MGFSCLYVDPRGASSLSVVVAIKPLSVNDAWKGQRFKTDNYKSYEKALLILLPKRVEIPEGKLKLNLEFGLSNMGGDTDNPIKPFVDVLQKKYSFNDSRIYKYEVEKVPVKKGFEYTKFRFEQYD